MTRAEPLTDALPIEIQHGTLLHLLANSLILGNTAPYLSCFDLLNLAAASRTLRFLVYHTPLVFRRLDLRHVRNAQFDVVGIDRGGETWRNTQLDEALTEDDFYSGPLRGIFHHLRRADILRDVQVLSLDGLSVTAELVHDILVDPSYSVRILSIRGAKNLNERKLRGALQYACRESRPKGMPRLRGLYVFGPKDADSGTGAVEDRLAVKKMAPLSPFQQPEPWYALRGSQFPLRISPEWASTLVACDGIIAFDTVLCTGPRHVNSPAWGSVNIDSLNAAAGSPAASAIPHFAVAKHSLGGCASCGAAPEGWTVWGESVSSMQLEPRTGVGRFPLLAPPPMHSANLEAAMCPAGQPLKSRIHSVSPGKATEARFIPRCLDCLRDRYCNGCHVWWCESCYVGPQAPVLGSYGEMDPDLEPVSDPSFRADDASLANEARPSCRVRAGFCWDGPCSRTPFPVGL
ncbi:hypothetical protein B0T18DRAFT_330462 [Schizothecium vesticola]|uniref:Ubiquitin fusion degradation protein n=1 Tax=Schizothecium vesticola TaxID=314040 RepID=A0AA40EP97_9PEZI|nr:hypothetical protein B0T18DRAFT_330462 [Schizothecium vesticola]